MTTSVTVPIIQEMGITLMLAGNMGMGAYNKLSAHGIAVIRGCCTEDNAAVR